MNARAALLLTSAAVLAITPACTASEPPVPDPFLLVEAAGSTSDAVDLVLTDLSGREVLRQSMGATVPWPSLHEASAQVAFWRDAGVAQELVVWNIATTALKVLATSAIPPAMSPVWSLDGTEVVSLNTTTPHRVVPFAGKAEILMATVASGQPRMLAADRLFVPSFANGEVVAGATFAGDKYVVVDARSGQTLRELALSATIEVLPTPNPDVLIAVRETSTSGQATLHALNVRSGAELGQLGQVPAQPTPVLSWPGRKEVVFVIGGDLKAFDYATNTTRVVGRLEGATAIVGFDALGKVLLAARPTDPFYGTITVAEGRLTSALKLIPRDLASKFGGALGLVRMKS